MAQRDDRHQQGGYREHNARQQMDQYADSDRQYGGDAPRSRDDSYRNSPYGGRNDLRHNDPTQASYGRFGAPDVHHQPSGGYPNQGYQERNRDDSYGYGGYGSQGFNAGGSDDRRGDGHQDRGRFQGGSGGFASNTGVYASSQTYGGPTDQLGYGSNEGGGHQGGHHDPEYRQWREEQMRTLDNDYHAWRGERYKKFSEEFGEWRRNRPAGDDTRGTGGASGSTVSTSIGAGPGGSNTGTSRSK